jgi:hypothetical protein
MWLGHQRGASGIGRAGCGTTLDNVDRRSPAFHSGRAREPAVNVKGLPGDETGVFARQKRDDSRQVGRLLGALNGLHV